MDAEVVGLIVCVVAFIAVLGLVFKLHGTAAVSFHQKLADLVNGEIVDGKVEFNQASFRVKAEQIAIGSPGSDSNRVALRVTYDLPTPCVLTIRDQMSVIGKMEKFLGAEDLELGDPAIDEAYLLSGSSQIWLEKLFAQQEAVYVIAAIFKDSRLFEISFSDEGLQVTRNIVGLASAGPTRDEVEFVASLAPLARIVAKMDTGIVPSADYCTAHEKLKADGLPALPLVITLLGAFLFFPCILFAQSLGVDINKDAETRDHIFMLVTVIAGCALYAAFFKSRLAKLGVGIYVTALVVMATGMFFWSLALRPYFFLLMGG